MARKVEGDRIASDQRWTQITAAYIRLIQTHLAIPEYARPPKRQHLPLCFAYGSARRAGPKVGTLHQYGNTGKRSWSTRAILVTEIQKNLWSASPLVTRCSHISLGRESRKSDNFMQQGQHSKGEETQALFQLLELRKKEKRRKNIWKGWNKYSTPEAQNVTPPPKSANSTKKPITLRLNVHLAPPELAFFWDAVSSPLTKRGGIYKTAVSVQTRYPAACPNTYPFSPALSSHPHPLSGSLSDTGVLTYPVLQNHAKWKATKSWAAHVSVD